jgi:hypothetical protein
MGTSKRQRVEHGSISTTSSGQNLINLLDWLKVCGIKGLEDDRFQFISSNGQCGGSLGCFASKDFKFNELLFAIPLKCIISLSNANSSTISELLRQAAHSFGEPALVTSELLIWIFMIQQLADTKSHFNPFLQSLDSESPSPLSWTLNLQSALNGTNMSTMSTSKSSIERHAKFLDEVRRWALETNRDFSFLGSDTFNLSSLIWARGHYLARRYPSEFSVHSSIDGSSSSSSGSTDNGDLDGREEGMMNLGALVPLLDILNHSPEREWLTFKVVDDFLHVVCNYPIEKGNEMFSNYGSLSNEMLLYAYGFCLENNSDDALTLQLMGTDTSVDKNIRGETTGPTGPVHMGTYYVTSGGMLGIPDELWKKLTNLIGEDPNSDGDNVEEEENSNKLSHEEVTDECSGTAKDVKGLDILVDVHDSNEQEVKESEEDNEEDTPVEIGIEECALLRDCIQKKLLLLEATQER